MSNPATETLAPMDPIVLARLTGNLGDMKTVAQRCSDVAALQCHLLGDMIAEEMQLEVDVEYTSHRSALRSALIAELGSGYTLISTSLRNWCPHFLVGVKNDLAITVIAQLLGDTGGPSAADAVRPLSTIEADVAALLLKRMVAVLRSGLTAAGEFEPLLSAPYAASDYAQHGAEFADGFAAAIRLSVKLGKLDSEVLIVIPQNVLLKTVITKPGVKAIEAMSDGMQGLGDHVLRSQVDLQARIRLASLKLKTIAGLKPGDTIPFEDVGEVNVDMDANGKMMYRCEFGRSGENYSVKIKSNTGSDGNVIRQALNI